MESSAAVKSLSALAHESRLAIFRLLVEAGPKGLAAGDIARRLNILPNTLSASLGVLANADLILARREGRSIFYSAKYEHMAALLNHLIQDCCGGRPEICAPLTAIAENACC